MTEQLSYQPSRSAVYYKPPRQVEPVRLTIAAASGVVVLIGLGTAYALVLPWMETIYTRVGTMLAFAGATGLVSLAVLHYARVSSQAVAAIVATALGLVAVYVAWVVWLQRFFWHFLHLSLPPWRLIVHPVSMFRIAREVNRAGTWMYGGDRITGIPLLVCWLIEAGGVVTASVFIGLRAADPRAPTCPDCRVPCKYVPGMPRLCADRADEVPAIAESQDFSRLLSLGALAHPDDPEVNFHVYTCPKCGLTNVMSAYRTAWTVEKGRHVVKSQTLVERMLIGPAHVEQLKAVKEELARRAAAPAETLEAPPETPVVEAPPQSGEDMS